MPYLIYLSILCLIPIITGALGGEKKEKKANYILKTNEN